MPATIDSEDRSMWHSTRRPSDSSELAHAMYNLWWPLAIIAMPESSTIIGFYALSYLVTQFDRHSCAAKFNVMQRPALRFQQLARINPQSAIGFGTID